MYDKAEHRVAAHQLVTERRAAGRPQWDLRLTLTFDPDADPATNAASLARQFKGSRWATMDLAAVKRDWAADGATAEPEFLYDTELGQIVDELDSIAESDDAEQDHINGVLDMMYDHADLGPTRVWVELKATTATEETN